MKDNHSINEKIRAKKVIIVRESGLSNPIDIGHAIQEAQRFELGLIQVSNKGEFSICRIIDYKKFLYDREKNKKKTTKTIIKEIQFKFNTDNNDFQRKIKDAEKFLKKGFKIRINVLIFGRNWEFKKGQAELMTLKLITALEEFGMAEYAPKMTNKKCIVL